MKHLYKAKECIRQAEIDQRENNLDQAQLYAQIAISHALVALVDLLTVAYERTEEDETH